MQETEAATEEMANASDSIQASVDQLADEAAQSSAVLYESVQRFRINAHILKRPYSRAPFGRDAFTCIQSTKLTVDCLLQKRYTND